MTMKLPLIAAFGIAFIASTAEAAPLVMKKGYPYARSIGECSQLAKARGWTRIGEQFRSGPF
jgi:hypothetical protein